MKGHGRQIEPWFSGTCQSLATVRCEGWGTDRFRMRYRQWPQVDGGAGEFEGPLAAGRRVSPRWSGPPGSTLDAAGHEPAARRLIVRDVRGRPRGADGRHPMSCGLSPRRLADTNVNSPEPVGAVRFQRGNALLHRNDLRGLRSRARAGGGLRLVPQKISESSWTAEPLRRHSSIRRGRGCAGGRGRAWRDGPRRP